MKVSDKYKKIFGSITHLSNSIPWTTGVSSMVEFLVWYPKCILGVSKKEYWKQIVKWSRDEEMNNLSLDEIVIKIDKKLKDLLDETEQPERYSRQSTGICSAREALRRIKYFSEDYLNKEFDIFMNLSSDKYLDNFYQQFIAFDFNHTWSTHGNSGIFDHSTELKAMYMDNLSYNSNEKILVANELKLNGKKNPDQILKYCLMYNYLENKGFIDSGTKFLLLFISGKNELYDLKIVIEKEVEYCRKKGRKDLITNEILMRTNHLSLDNISWQQMIEFNELYIQNLDKNCQVEKKLLEGFNRSLSEKSFMQ